MSALALFLRLVRALVAVAAREVIWTLPNVSRELQHWRERALEIPDPGLRRCALDTLRQERMNAVGAALFAVLPPRCDKSLLSSLVAYQVALDYLDTLTERPSSDVGHGFQLHLALIEALDPSRPISNYFSRCPWEDDGGYLRALVERCREGCEALPEYAIARDRALLAAERLSVQVLNHISDPEERTRALQSWAEARGEHRVAWFEATGAASSNLGIYALLAAAAGRRTTREDAAAIDAAYHPWICVACTFMDSFVDQADDRATGDHCYVAHYADSPAAVERICELVRRAVREAASLPRGGRHAVIVTGMVSMYLSKETARGAELRDGARRIAREIGWLGRVEVPVTRAMRRVQDRDVRA